MVLPIIIGLAALAGISYGGKQIVTRYIRWQQLQKIKIPETYKYHEQLTYMGNRLPREHLGTGFQHVMNYKEARAILNMK